LVGTSIEKYPDQMALANLNKADIQRWLAPKASDKELEIFLRFCHSQGLNPFAKDVYLIPFEDKRAGVTRHSIVVGIQAYLKKASRNPNYQSYEAGIVVLRNGLPVEIPGTMKYPGDTLFGGWCRVHKKGAPVPFRHTVELNRWNKGQNVWASHPEHMIMITALRQCLRMAIPEEYGPEIAGETIEGMPYIVADAEVMPEMARQLQEPTAPRFEPPEAECPIHHAPWRQVKGGGMMHVVEGEQKANGKAVWCKRRGVNPRQPPPDAQDTPANDQGGLSDYEEASLLIKPDDFENRRRTFFEMAMERLGYEHWNAVAQAAGYKDAEAVMEGTDLKYVYRELAKLGSVSIPPPGDDDDTP